MDVLMRFLLSNFNLTLSVAGLVAPAISLTRTVAPA